MKNIVKGIGLVLGILTLWIGFTLYTMPFLSSLIGVKPHELGDSFGGINTLFSGLALIGVIYSIVIQNKELIKSVEAQKDIASHQADLIKLESERELLKIYLEAYKESNGRKKLGAVLNRDPQTMEDRIQNHVNNIELILNKYFNK